MRKKKTITKIMKLKDSMKKEMEIEVKKASDKVDDEKNRLKELESEYHEKLDRFSANNHGETVTASSITSYYEFFSRISGKISKQKDVHMQRKGELDLLKENLMEVHRDKKMFEILHDKAADAERREKTASEQKEYDFFALSRKLR